MNNQFSFLQGIRPQPLQFSGGYNRSSLDFSRPLSNFAGGYNQQMQPLETATQEPVGGYMKFNPPATPAAETAQQSAPSLLGYAQPSENNSGDADLAAAKGVLAKTEQMTAQGSPMLSQVQQMGGRYQRRYTGLLG